MRRSMHNSPKKMTTSRTLMLSIMCLIAASLSACSVHQEPTDPGGNNNGPVVTIDLINFSFSQPTVTISPGTTVRWTNTTSSFHTVTPDGHTEWTEWQTTTTGETFEVTFDTPGTYPYYCMPHRALGMTGTVVVL